MATAKKKVTTKSRKNVSKAKAIDNISFQIGKETVPFLTFKFTEQTFYWIILLAMILALAIWVLNIQLSTTDILNSIRVTN